MSELRWKVTRFCCRSGNCGDCRAGFDKTKRLHVLHADCLSERSARVMARNWDAYDAVAAPMEVQPGPPTAGLWFPPPGGSRT